MTNSVIPPGSAGVGRAASLHSPPPVPPASSKEIWLKHIWWQLALLTIFSYLAYASSNKVDDEMSRFMPETVVDCSSYNGHGSGYRAMYELCNKSGISPSRFEGSYRDLAKLNEKSILVVVAPTFPMMSFEVDRVLDWVARGNSLVYLDYCMYGSGKYLLDKLGLKPSMSISIDDFVAKAPAGVAEMQHVDHLLLSSETRLSGGTTLVGDERGALIVQVAHGRGKCLIATVPNLCSNRRISEKSNWGNFQFLINWLKSGNGKVIFDERAHGHMSSQSIFVYLARGPVGLICLQLLILFVLALLSLNQRFGPPRFIAVKRKIATKEFIDGMALTYEKARAYDAAFAILFNSFRTRLCKALSLSPQDNNEEIARAWSQATGLSNERTLRFLQSSDQLQNSKATEEMMLAAMEECDQLYSASKDHLAVGPGRRLNG